MEYAQEALESLAVNATNCFESQKKAGAGPQPIESLSSMLTMTKQIEDKADKQLAIKLKEEIESLKQDTKGTSSALAHAIETLEDKMQTSSKYLPPMVRSARYQVVHRNSKQLVYSPSTSWKTSCGWYYYLANYQFVEGSDAMVTCAKCLSAQRKEVEVADN